MLLNILSLAGFRALGDRLREQSHELAIAVRGGKRGFGQSARVFRVSKSGGGGRAAGGKAGGEEGEDQLVAGEARVGTELLLGADFVRWLAFVADDLLSERRARGLSSARAFSRRGRRDDMR